MGAVNFDTRVFAKTAKEAFRSAVKQAEYDFGHSGYTGSIAEKHNFTMIFLPEGKDPEDYMWELIDNEDKRISDKWGPAGCIEIVSDPPREDKLKEFIFFGWASS